MWGVTIVFLGLSNSQSQLFFIYFVSSIYNQRKKKNRNKPNTTTKYSQLFSMCTCPSPTHFHDIFFLNFQVRKEKLGDRITALHQLVSPFGKVIN
jgi:hypothetical protein